MKWNRKEKAEKSFDRTLSKEQRKRAQTGLLVKRISHTLGWSLVLAITASMLGCTISYHKTSCAPLSVSVPPGECVLPPAHPTSCTDIDEQDEYLVSMSVGDLPPGMYKRYYVTQNPEVSDVDYGDYICADADVPPLRAI